MSPPDLTSPRSGRRQRRAAALLLIGGLTAAACAGSATAINGQPNMTQTPAENPVMPPASAAVLPVMYVPSSDGLLAHGGAVAPENDDLCRFASTTCVPPGVYEQQAAAGDWCSWHYYPAEYFREPGQGDDLEALVVPNWKDADGTLITLREGDQLSYGPTTGAIRFSEGLPASEGWEGDGHQRGCAEWIQVGTLDNAVRVPKPTAEECARLVEAGASAAAVVESLTNAFTEETERLEDVILAALGGGLAEPPPGGLLDGLWDLLIKVMAEIVEAEPKVERAATCHEFLGNADEASLMSDTAFVYRSTWGEIRQQCPAQFAPIGFDCSRL